MTTTYADTREFLKRHKYEISRWQTKDGMRYEVRMYRGAPHGLFRREYQSVDSAIRNLGLAQQFEQWKLQRWQEATR